MKQIVLWCSIFCLTLLFACTKKKYNPDKLTKTPWNPSLAIPLMHASLDMNDLVKIDSNELFQVGQDNFITLVYSSEIYSLYAEEVVFVPNQAFNHNYQVGTTLGNFPQGNTLNVPTTQNITFFSGTNNIDSVRYKQGNMYFEIKSSIGHDINIQFLIPDAVKNGAIFSSTINLPYNNTPHDTTVLLDMTGYMFDLTKGGTTANELDITINTTITGTGGPINATDQIDIRSRFEDFKFQALYGNVGLGQFSTQVDSVNIEVFKAADGFGSFALVNPSVTVKLKNSIGIPMDAQMNTLIGINTISGASMDLSSNAGIPSPLVVPYPLMNQQGQTKVDSFTLNDADVATFVNLKPNLLSYSVTGISNPGSSSDLFILDTSRFSAEAIVHLPLYGRADLFALRDTIDFSLSGTDINEIEEFILSLKIDNGFPLDVYTQLYLLDENNILIDSIFDSNTKIISAASVDANGIATQSTSLQTDVTLDQRRRDNITKTKYIIVQGQSSTPNNGTTDVKIYTDYLLDVKIGLKTKIKTRI